MALELRSRSAPLPHPHPATPFNGNSPHPGDTACPPPSRSMFGAESRDPNGLPRRSPAKSPLDPAVADGSGRRRPRSRSTRR